MFAGLEKHTQVDEKRLRKTALARRVGQYLSTKGGAHSPEVGPVVDMARMLARDLELSVRSTLAFELRHSDQVPKDLAERIAKDVEDVAEPFLGETPIFTDQELSRLVPALAEHAKAAIARRRDVGPMTSSALVVSGGDRSVTSLMRNERAALEPRTLERVYSRFNESTPVLDALAARPDLPLSIVERLVERVTDSSRVVLMRRYGLKKTVIGPMTQRVRLDTLFTRFAKASSDQVRAYLTDLKTEKRLDHTLAYEALKRHDVRTFEIAMAVTAGEVVGIAREALRHGGDEGRVRMLSRAGFDRADLARLSKQVEALYAT